MCAIHMGNEPLANVYRFGLSYNHKTVSLHKESKASAVDAVLSEMKEGNV